MNRSSSKINLLTLRDPSISTTLSGIHSIIRRKLAGICTAQKAILKWAAAVACSTRTLLNTTSWEPSVMTWPRLSMVRHLEMKSPTLSLMKRTRRTHRLLNRWSWMPKTRVSKLTYKSRNLHPPRLLSRSRSRQQPHTLDQPRPQDRDQDKDQNRPREKHLPPDMHQPQDKHHLRNQPLHQLKRQNKLRPRRKLQPKSLNCKHRHGPRHHLPNPLRLLTRHNRASPNFQCLRAPPPSLPTRTRVCNSALARKRRKRRISLI